VGRRIWWNHHGNTVFPNTARHLSAAGSLLGSTMPWWCGQTKTRFHKSGWSAQVPGDQVIGFTVAGWFVAAGEDSTHVTQFQGCPDGYGDQTLHPADVERFGWADQHHREDVGVTQQLPDYRCGEGSAGTD
jgi:hypothetical protein